MCLGFPMTVVSGDALQAVCERKGERETVSMLLIGSQEPGTCVLVHLGTAMRILDADESRSVDAALDGLAAALNGEDFDSFFSDLIDREPQLPAFLRKEK